MLETGKPVRATADSVLAEVIRRIVEVAHPDKVILFGSAARGEAGPDSDLDFLVIKSGVDHRGQLAGEIYRHLFGIPVPVDVLVLTPEDVEYLKHKPGSVVAPALREGRVVYGAEAS